uniref:Uncharacterized protein n=1 Tax=Arundo donax TaxID=35708 RepID=A0A0A8Y0N7_ARUDO
MFKPEEYKNKKVVILHKPKVSNHPIYSITYHGTNCTQRDKEKLSYPLLNCTFASTLLRWKEQSTASLTQQ